jgi:heme exporter protein A
LYAQLYDVPEAAERAAFSLERVGLADRADVQVGRLSRGQQQRVTIARALLHEPAVLLLDEPDTGLDVAAFGLFAELATAEGKTVVVTTHDLSSGLQLATRVAVLARGRLVHEQANTSPDDAAALSDMLQALAGRHA